MGMIYIIPDTQSKMNVKNPLVAIAHHICELKPRRVIHLGDHWDFPSLSSYDKGKKSHRVHTYHFDIDAGNNAMLEFWHIIEKKWPKYQAECSWDIFQGNHEHRRYRAMEYCDDNMLTYFKVHKPDYTNWNSVHKFLKIVKLDGINFCHYFQNDGSARPIGTAQQLVTKKHSSCIAGHKQGYEYAEKLTDDKVIQCMIIGSCYYHEEDYKPQSNHHWRGSVVLYNVDGEGGYDFARYKLGWLDKTYSNLPI